MDLLFLNKIANGVLVGLHFGVLMEKLTLETWTTPGTLKLKLLIWEHFFEVTQ